MSLPVLNLRVMTCSLGFKVCKPAQRGQARHEAVFTATSDDEVRDALEAFPKRPARESERTTVSVRPDDRVFVFPGPDEDPVVNPLGLDKLELPAEVCPNECEYQPPVGTVIFEDALGKRRAVRGSASYHSVYPHHARYLCVAWVCPPYVRAARGLETVRVVLPKKEIVVAQRVCAQFPVIAKRAERQGGAAAPAPHHLSRRQLLIFGPLGVLLQVASERSHALMQLAKDNIRPVAAQDFGHGFLNAAHLVRITEHELAGFERLLLRVTPSDAASLYGGVAYAVPEPKRLCFGWQCVAVLTPNSFDPCHLTIGFSCPIEGRFELLFVRRHRDDDHVDIPSPQGLFPVFGCALTNVVKVFGSRRHPLTKLPRKAVERLLRHTEGFETLVGVCDTYPSVGQRAPGVGRGGHRAR